MENLQKKEVSPLSSTADTTTEAPRDDIRDAEIARVLEALGTSVVDSLVKPNDDMWIRVSADAWVTTGETLKSLGYTYFCFISAIDWMPSPFGKGEEDPSDPIERSTTIKQGYTGGDTRFQVLARLVQPFSTLGINIKVDVDDNAMAIDSWVQVFAGANWHERETHEMFGIGFNGHPDLRNMYLPTDFEGHPLRKDFPLLARHVKPWPGIVDVEPLPGDDSEEEGAAS
ncbi:MAG: NADH-quinone oxidoreductase subunit [Actinomycetota bacterium]|jgi:NADH-quinone oxidoreductase subunit C